MSKVAGTAIPPEYRWGFLERPAERLRYAVIASLIKSHADRGLIVEIGADRGHLLGWLDPHQTTAFVAVDPDAALLETIKHEVIPVTRVAARMEDYVPEAGPVAALVASEVLFYVDAPAEHLVRIWRAAGPIGLVLVSTVRPIPGKPNWQRGYERVQRALAETGWPVLDRVIIDSATERLSWEVVALKPGSAR